MAAPRPAPAPAPRPRDRFAVASENATGVEVAREVLDAGGSAADAAVAGILVACAAHPSSCGLGGGGVAIVVDARGEAAVVDFRETAPHGLRRRDHIVKTPPEKKRGVMVGVPGLAAGLSEIHRRGGKLAWRDVVGRAAAAVERGFPLSPYMAQAYAWNAKWIKSDERAKKIAVVDAEARVGVTIENPALARTLRALAEGGADAFYQGPLAEDVVATARAAGSRVTRADLAGYRAAVRPPIVQTFGGHEILAPPPPAGGGVAVTQMLGFVRADDIRKMEWGGADLVHVLAEGFRASYVDRGLFVGDPEYSKIDLAALFDADKLRARRARVKMDATTMPKLPSIAEGGTLQLTVIDDAGAAVSATVTLTSAFGAKLVTDGGFALNDALSDFTVDEYGQRVTTRGANFPRGGARPASSLAPLVVRRDGHVVLALGASGGLRALTSVTQVVLAHLGVGRPLAEAVAAPRFHVSAGGALKIEAGLAATVEELVARGEVAELAGPTFAGVSGIAVRTEDGVRVLEPVFDPRKGGAVTVGRAEPVTGGGPSP